jgi:transposase
MQATQMQSRTNPDYTKGKVTMPILKARPKQPKTTVVQLRLDEEARSTLTKYSEYLECSPSHVVTEALRLVRRKDKEFQSWLSGERTKASKPNSKGESFQLELK